MNLKRLLATLILCSSFQLILKSQVTADFKILVGQGCSPLTAIFENTSAKGVGITYTWVFSVGSSPVIQSSDTVSQIYINPGVYIVTLTASKGTQTSTKIDSVRVYKNPIAGFKANFTQGCLPLTVQFTDTSTQGDGKITDWYWDFNDNTSSTLADPVKIYYNTGTFSVYLKVTDANGCSSYTEPQNYITLVSQPEVNFSVNKSFSCVTPLPVVFKNLTTTALPLSYLWNFGDGDTSTAVSPTHIYTQKGNFSVKLTATNSFQCSGASTYSNLINIPDIVAAFELVQNSQPVTDTVCPNLNVTFTNKSTSAQYSEWIFADTVCVADTNSASSNTFTYSFRTPGKYVITFVAGLEYPCPDTIRKTIIVENSTASFSFEPNYTCQLPFTILLTNTSVNALSWTWSMGDSLINNNIKNYSFTFSKNYFPIDSFKHDTTPERVYAGITTISPHGCKNTYKDTIPVTFDLPVARFMPDKVNGCIPLTVNFRDTSKSRESIISRIWLFGDGTELTGNVSDTSHTYTKAGVFNVKLVIINQRGCSDTSYTVQIAAGSDSLHPQFSVSPSAVCANDPITFTYLGPTTNINSWDYFSPTAGIQTACTNNPNPTLSIKPDTMGFADITLRVGSNGCFSDTTLKNAIYIRGPVVSFTAQFSCDSSYSYSFTGDICNASNWIWNYGDGKTDANKVNTFHQYASSGNYLVNLSATNDTTPCTSSFTQLVRVRKPEAVITIKDTVCIQKTTLFSASSSKDYIDSCHMDAFIWNFGDQSKPVRTYKIDTTHTYSLPNGNIRVKLTVIAANGCRDTTLKLIYGTMPKATFTTNVTNGCYSSFPVIFTNTLKDSSVVKWTWSFGDLTTDNKSDTTVVHTYNYIKMSSSDTIFTTQLNVTDMHGCAGQTSSTITMFKPEAAFSANRVNICKDDSVNFSMTDSNLDSVTWNFGDGSPTRTTLSTSDSHTYLKRGSFNVTATAYENVCNVSNTLTGYINVQAAYAQYSLSDTISNCYPVTIKFKQVSVPDPIIGGSWSFGYNHNTSSGYSDSASYTYIMPGTDTTGLWVETSNGCKDTAHIIITIHGPSASFTDSPEHICKGDTVHFKITSMKNVVKFQWFYGDGLSSALNDSSPKHVYYNFGNFIPTLSIEDNQGCSPLVKEDTIQIYNVKALFNIVDSAICQYVPAQFINNSIDVTNYKWNFGNGDSSTQFNPGNINFPNPGHYVIRLSVISVISDKEECKDTTTASLTSIENPSITMSNADTVCNGNGAIISVTTNPINTVYWLPTTGLSNATMLNPFAKPSNTTKYTVYVTNTVGCQDSGSVMLYVENQPTLVCTVYKQENEKYTQDTALNNTIVIGDSIRLITQLTDNSMYYSQSYSWSPDTGLSCKTCSMPWLIALQNNVYVVIVKDKCFQETCDFNLTVNPLFTVDMPKAFLPYGEGANSVLTVRGAGIKELLEFKIYDRWGELMFSTNDINEGWDGTYKGVKQPIDSYVYFIRVKMYRNDQEITKKGSVTILR